MTAILRWMFSADPGSSQAREARRKLVRKITVLILAEADALQARQDEEFSDRLCAMSFLDEEEADPGLLRRFVDSAIYRWLTSAYVAGDTGEHPLCRSLDILHDLAPGAFAGPGHQGRNFSSGSVILRRQRPM